MTTTTVDYRRISYEINDRLSTAAGETAMEIVRAPTWAEDYGDDFKELVDRLLLEKKRTRGFVDVEGSIADALYNLDDFWDMARDWICDGIGQQGIAWDDPSWSKHYDAACDALAKVVPFKKNLILSWKEK